MASPPTTTTPGPACCPPVSETVGITFDDLLTSLEMRPVGRSARGTTYEASTQPEPADRVFGGLLLAQAIAAGSVGAEAGMAPLSLQAEFLGGVPVTGSVRWLVEDLGSSPSMRSVRASVVADDGAPLFTAHLRGAPVRGDLPSYSLVPRRRVPGPDGLEDLVARYGGDELVPRWWRIPRPVEFRHVEPPSYLAPETPPAAEQTIWWRAPARPDADPVLAAAVTAYASDMSVVEPVFRQTGSARHRGRSRILSLTHTLTFHHPAPLGKWLQMDCAVLSLAHGRARGTAEVHGPAGHVASFSQLALVKLD